MKKAWWAAALVVSLPVSSHAQLNPTERMDVIAGALARSADPTGRSPLQTAPVFSIEATTSETIASAQLGFQLEDLTLKFGLRAPLDKSSERTPLADLNGLRNRSTASVSGTWSFFDVADPAPLLVAACDEYAAETGTPIEPCTLLELRRRNPAIGRRVRSRIDPGILYLVGAELSVSPDTYNFATGPAADAVRGGAAGCAAAPG